MSEELIMGQQPGQAETLTPNPSSDGQAAVQASPEYATTAQLAELEKKLTSQAQSLVDKSRNTINAKIEQMKSFGVTVTPEQAQAMVESEALSQSSAHPAQAAQPDAATGEPVDEERRSWIQAQNADPADPYWNSVYEISKNAGGMLIEDGDPELEMLKDFKSGADFVSKFARAIAAKELRQRSDNQSYAATPALFSSGQKSTMTPQDADYRSLYRKGFAGS